MPRLKISIGSRDKNDEQETYVPADELSVEETDNRGEEDMPGTTSTGDKQPRKRKKGKKAEDAQKKAKRKLDLTQAWGKSLRDANEDLDEVLEEDDLEELTGHVAKLNKASYTRGQQLLMSAKQTTVLGDVMAVNEVTSQIRETKDNVMDVYHGGKWAVQKIAGLFGGGA